MGRRLQTAAVIACSGRRKDCTVVGLRIDRTRAERCGPGRVIAGQRADTPGDRVCGGHRRSSPRRSSAGVDNLPATADGLGYEQIVRRRIATVCNRHRPGVDLIDDDGARQRRLVHDNIGRLHRDRGVARRHVAMSIAATVLIAKSRRASLGTRRRATTGCIGHVETQRIGRDLLVDDVIEPGDGARSTHSRRDGRLGEIARCQASIG